MADFVTVVIKLPEDPENRHLITSALRLGEEFHGGLITGMSLEDELTRGECLEEQMSVQAIEAAEAKMRQILNALM